MDYNVIVILGLCILLIPIYYKGERFNRFWGITLFLISFLALFMRLRILHEYPLLAFYNQKTIIASIILVGVPGIILLGYSVFSEHFKTKRHNFAKLIFPYLFFGALQQIFFCWLFTDMFFYLQKNIFITYTASVIYFMVFHFGWPKKLYKFYPLLVAFALISVSVYLFLGNIFPQMMIHGLAGTCLFAVFSETDQIKRRLGRS